MKKQEIEFRDSAGPASEELLFNPSHGTMSKTMEHIGLAQLKQLKAMMRFQEFLKAKEKKG